MQYLKRAAMVVSIDKINKDDINLLSIYPTVF